MGEDKQERPQTIRACPRCYAKNPKAPGGYLAYDPAKPDVRICEKVHGEIPLDEALKGPEFYITHYELP